MRKRLIRALCILVAVTVLSGMLAGCGDTKRVTTTDGKLRIDIPKDWKESSNKSNKDADLSVSSSNGGLYFIVIKEDKPKDAKNPKLENYYQLVGNKMVNSSPNSKIINPVGKTINQHDTINFQFVSVVNKVQVSYLVTLIDTKNSYYQLIGWTLDTRFEAARPQFEKIVNSFKVIGE
jgi:hypothetical protein